jgi:hypothetical protein
MADERVFSNGNVTTWVVPVTGIADYRSPTAAEINAGLNLTDAIAWDGTTFPTASESNDIDDRSLLDKGNATSRGFAQWEAVLNFFYPKNPLSATTDNAKAFQFFRGGRVEHYVITRVLQGTEGVLSPAVAGQDISVFKFVSDQTATDTEGENSYKLTVTEVAQGELAIHTLVKDTNPVVITLKGDAIATVGDKTTYWATIGSKYMTQNVEWVSSDTSVADVTPNGVVIAIGTGTADITATHPAATGATVPVTITVA